MKLAFMYAGQGSQHPGMGEDLYGDYPEFREAFDSADLDFDLKEVCFSDKDGILNQTRYTQPCMVAFATGVSAILKNMDIVPEYAAGLSLGEYSALQAAGVFDTKTAIELVAFRGKAMEEAAAGLSCGMYAVLGMEEAPLKECCEKASDKGVVTICNYNCPGQLVISGEKEAVDAAAALAKEAGAKRAMPLKVSGPFHTSLMEPASKALAERFGSVDFKEPAFPVLFNCLGDVKGDGDSIPALLTRQVKESVYMEKMIRKLADYGVDTIIEIGPGKAISGFVKKTSPQIRCIPVETSADIAGLREKLSEV